MKFYSKPHYNLSVTENHTEIIFQVADIYSPSLVKLLNELHNVLHLCIYFLKQNAMEKASLKFQNLFNQVLWLRNMFNLYFDHMYYVI